MATKKEIEDQIAQLQADLEGADDDVELLVEHPKTKAVGRLRGAHAKSFLDGILGTDEPADGAKGKGKAKGKAKDADDDDPDDDDDADAPPAKTSVWGRK